MAPPEQNHEQSSESSASEPELRNLARSLVMSGDSDEEEAGPSRRRERRPRRQSAASQLRRSYRSSGVVPHRHSEPGPSNIVHPVPLQNPYLLRSRMRARLQQEARKEMSWNDSDFECMLCWRVPRMPVTGECGHTCCRACFERHGACPCGEPAPNNLATNILAQRVFGLLYGDDEEFERSWEQRQRDREMERQRQREIEQLRQREEEIIRQREMDRQHQRELERLRRQREIERQNLQQRYNTSSQQFSHHQEPQPGPSTSRAGMPERARVYNWRHRYHFRHHANEPDHERPSTSGLHYQRPRRALEVERTRNFISQGEFDCILCSMTFRSPVTTPCGHTFCRPCVERCMDFKLYCPLCNASLLRFNVDATDDTVLISSALHMAGVSTAVPHDDDDRLPIFVCTVAYPMVPCPLYVFEPRYRLMLRRCLRSGSRRFGMVAPDPENRYADFGTVLEIRDCLRLEDGRSILSTVGISRFRVLERFEKDGYDVAHVQRIADQDYENTNGVAHMYRIVHDMWHNWYRSISARALDEIYATFGPKPFHGHYTADDGPAFMWWVLAMLPLPTNIKISILKNTFSMKRFAALSRAFVLMQRHAASSALNGPRALADRPWMERAA